MVNVHFIGGSSVVQLSEHRNKDNTGMSIPVHTLCITMHNNIQYLRIMYYSIAVAINICRDGLKIAAVLVELHSNRIH